MADEGEVDLRRSPIRLGPARFLRARTRQLAGSLEDVIGLKDAKGYFSLVGNEIGRSCCTAPQRERFDRPDSRGSSPGLDFEREAAGS